MPYRVPGGNLVGRFVGLGNLDKAERERRAQRMYNHRIHTETDQRLRQCFNDGRDTFRMPPSRYPHHDHFNQEGLTHNMDECRRRFEDSGLHYSGMDRKGQGHHWLGTDVDDWSQDQVMKYYYDYYEDIHFFMRDRKRVPDGRRLPPHSERYWVRMYREYLQRLYQHAELTRQEEHQSGGRRRGPLGGWRGYGRHPRMPSGAKFLDEERIESGDDIPYSDYYGRRPHHEDEEDEEDE